jgi:hypothetical protein
MKAPMPRATDQVKMRWPFGDHLATRKTQIELQRTRARRKNDEIAVIKLWRRFGIESAPMPSAVAAAAIKARIVVAVISALSGLPNVRTQAPRA